MSDPPAAWPWQADAALSFSVPVPRRAQLFASPESGAVGSSLLDGMAADDIERVARAFGESAAHARPMPSIAARYFAPGGRCIVLELIATPIFDSNGSLVGYRGEDRDITTTGLLAFDQGPDILDKVYATAPVAICVVGRDGCLLSVNNKHAELVGRPVSELIGSKVRTFSPEGGDNVARDFAVFDADGTVPDHEFKLGDRTFHVSVAPLRDDRRKVSAVSVAFLDITDKKSFDRELAEANRRLNELVVHDHLTGQFNRRYFEDALETEFKRLSRSGGTLSLAIIDVDFFKNYNDRYGHVAGDQCLANVATAVADALLRPDDFICRYGGEEFVAVMGDTDATGARHAAERIREGVARLGIPHEASPYGHVSVSIGIATIDHAHAASVAGLREELVGAADRALYVAKSQGRNRVAAASNLGSDAGAKARPALRLVAR